VLQLDNLEGKSLPDILRMTPSQAESFRDWVGVVERERGRQRWAKLARLAPVRELALPGADGASRIIQIEYRPIPDPGGRVKFMALAQDVTQKRALEMRLKEEKTRHENRVKIILGVAGHAEEAIAGFLKDAARRLDSMLEALLSGEAGWRRRVFFDCHTLKGNAGGFGFDALAQAAQDLETHLERLAEESDDVFRGAMQDSLRILDEERCRIGEVYRLLYGSLEKPHIRLDPDKVERVKTLAQEALRSSDPGVSRELAATCRTLHYRRLESFALKYQELLERAARKLGKEADFVVATFDAELDPTLIQRVDESLVHIFRNALAHGIEDPETRARRGKGKGLIELSYSRTANGHAFSVRDDGNGIDGEALAAKAVAMGLLDPRDAARLGPEEKARLIFEAGLSTASGADCIAGRGQGMAIVRERIRAMRGDVSVETRAGAGTCFTLFLPHAPAEESAPAEPLASPLPITA
jgi:two-component system, chemotaxis family, sensor kinase CheA